MTLQEGATQDGPSLTMQNTRLAVIATLLASLIGGAFGFGGSLLVFFSSKESLVQAGSQHTDDVRRETYANYVADSTKIRTILQASSARAVAAGRTLDNDNCNLVDLFVAEEESLIRVYLISPTDDVNNKAYQINTALHDWHDSLCTPGLLYTQEMKDSSRDSVDRAQFFFRQTAKATLTR